ATLGEVVLHVDDEQCTGHGSQSIGGPVQVGGWGSRSARLSPHAWMAAARGSRASPGALEIAPGDCSDTVSTVPSAAVMRPPRLVAASVVAPVPTKLECTTAKSPLNRCVSEPETPATGSTAWMGCRRSWPVTMRANTRA